MEEKRNLNGEVEIELAVQKEPVADIQTRQSSNTSFLLPGAILIAALIISGTLLFTRGGSSGVAQIGGAGAKPSNKVDVGVGAEDHVLGNPDAKIAIVEFSDFQCPFCRSFWSGALVQIKKEYIDTGKAKFVYKHYPLDFHPGARPAAEASECAGDQNKFWEFHDKAFEEQAKLGQGTVQFGNPEIVKWALAIGLNMTKFNECFNSGKYSQRVSDDFAYGAQVGVSGTPTTFINGQSIVGAQPFATFKAIIDASAK